MLQNRTIDLLLTPAGCNLMAVRVSSTTPRVPPLMARQGNSNATYAFPSFRFEQNAANSGTRRFAIESSGRHASFFADSAKIDHAPFSAAKFPLQTCSVSRPHPILCERVSAIESLPHSSVLRNLCEGQKSRTTGATIVVVSQPHHHGAAQTRGSAGNFRFACPSTWYCGFVSLK